MIEQIIKEYLQSNKRLIVPAVGAFIRKDDASVAFVPFMKKDDGVLTGLIATAFDIDEPAAQHVVEEFSGTVKAVVDREGFYVLDGFGKFRKDLNGALTFEATEGIAVKDEPVNVDIVTIETDGKVTEIKEVNFDVSKPATSPDDKISQTPEVTGPEQSKKQVPLQRSEFDKVIDNKPATGNEVTSTERKTGASINDLYGNKRAQNGESIGNGTAAGPLRVEGTEPVKPPQDTQPPQSRPQPANTRQPAQPRTSQQSSRSHQVVQPPQRPQVTSQSQTQAARPQQQPQGQRAQVSQPQQPQRPAQAAGPQATPQQVSQQQQQRPVYSKPQGAPASGSRPVRPQTASQAAPGARPVRRPAPGKAPAKKNNKADMFIIIAILAAILALGAIIYGATTTNKQPLIIDDFSVPVNVPDQDSVTVTD